MLMMCTRVGSFVYIYYNICQIISYCIMYDDCCLYIVYAFLKVYYYFIYNIYMRIQQWQNNEFIDGGRKMVEVLVVNGIMYNPCGDLIAILVINLYDNIV